MFPMQNLARKLLTLSDMIVVNSIIPDHSNELYVCRNCHQLIRTFIGHFKLFRI